MKEDPARTLGDHAAEARQHAATAARRRRRSRCARTVSDQQPNQLSKFIRYTAKVRQRRKNGQVTETPVAHSCSASRDQQSTRLISRSVQTYFAASTAQADAEAAVAHSGAAREAAPPACAPGAAAVTAQRAVRRA